MEGGPRQSEPAGGGQQLPKSTLAKLEDLELALDAAARVNKHLNAEAAALVSELRRAQRERDAWQRHAQQLARALAAERRRKAGGGASVSSGGGEQQVPQAQQQDGDGGGGGSGGEGGTSKQQQQQGRQRRQAEAEAELDAAGEAEARALAELPPEMAAAAAHGAAADPPPSAFEWPGGADGRVSALVAKGRAAGWIVAPGDVQLGALLGAGAFGETHRGRWRGADVAVKKVRVASESELVNFLREVECLAALRHPGVVPFLGAVLQGSGRCWLLAEYMPGGNMASYLHGGKGAAPALIGPDGHRRPLAERLERASEVAAALAALEACAPPVLHRDVKPSNVFVDGAGRARLGDFGLARLAPASAATLTGETGTYLYMAPEMIRHEVYDAKADVWSFGVLLAEIITTQIPYVHTYLTPVQIAMAVADETLQPVLPSSLPASLLALAHACCDFDPGMRPSFAVVCEELAAAIEEVKAADAAAAARGSLLGRLQASAAVPSSWLSVLSQITS
ncbi:hypothetical protein Rsub_01935 [Raphidocelis subcapitata]|uniref:Protein kinase domain-containing protein n=1 Tax=Raphidocelis subcapitata TaxID=307507 RepID=A0A2V0NUY3_9CHLO|nr:hypothetical protein Rsub_01935 [Raphidocelis subcapitata]|eukprot:GBF89363.1 hypothetical protein Rsub_01935 [Raphidocelis subcapitata]